ncbi:hypothetical protein BJ912DRAFT_1064398 [Pholiota molesta]|nr:hypothetical protein BJ912DRAFT_1064398 [Pholiota molesta]
MAGRPATCRDFDLSRCSSCSPQALRRAPCPLLSPRCPPRHLHLGTSSDAAQDVTKAVGAEERQDVSTMDQLLRVVREKSDPTYHSVMPMRSPSSGPRPSSARPPTSTPRRQNSPPRLPPRSPSALLEEYTNASGGIRTGKLMEHLDSLAGSIAYKHMLGPACRPSAAYRKRASTSSPPPLTGKSLITFYLVEAHLIIYVHHVFCYIYQSLDMLSPLDPARDLRLSGQVIYTGRSSMEVAVKMEHIGRGRPDETVLLGVYFRFLSALPLPSTLAAPLLDGVPRRAHEPLARGLPAQDQHPEERALYALGEHMRARRQSAAQTSLARVPPSSAEAAALHEFYLQHGEAGSTTRARARRTIAGGLFLNGVWRGLISDGICVRCLLRTAVRLCDLVVLSGKYMALIAADADTDAVLRTCACAYALRTFSLLILNLGFTNAAMFTRGHVKFLSLDGISFARPVPIGSILRLRSQILHTTTAAPHYAILVHVGVKANVVDVQTGLEQTTNDFRFTWCQERGAPAAAARELRQVVPKTYREAMLWLEGKRALAVGAEIRDQNLRVNAA